MVSVDSNVKADAPSEPTAAGSGAPPKQVGSVIALSVSLAFGVFLVAAPLIWQVLPITELPAPLPSHHQDAETAIFFLTYGLLLPFGIWSARRLAARAESGPNEGSLAAVSPLLLAGLAVVVIFTRISVELPWGGGPGVLAAGGIVWWAFAAWLLRRMTRAQPWVLRTPVSRLWLLDGVLLAGVMLCFTDLGSISVPVLLVGLLVGVAVLAVRERVRIPTLSRRAGLAIDCGIVILLAFAIPNLVILASGDPGTGFETQIIQFHQNFYLGPANQVLAGDAVLVDVLSQYGVGSIYFLAGAFKLLPINYGTLGLIEGLLSVLMFVGAFVTLRIAGVSRLLAGAAMALAVIVLVWGLEFPLGGLLQHGAFRFGLPVGVVMGAAAEARWKRFATSGRGFQLLTVAVAATWALEAFVYTLFTAACVALFFAAIRPAAARKPELVRRSVQIVGAVIVSHVLFAIATLAFSGSLPDWGWYATTLESFLFGELADLTFDFSSFSSAFPVAALYLASGAAVSIIVLRRRDLVERHTTILVSIVGMTAWGIALFTYLVNRGSDHIIPYVCLPAVALGALWLTFIGRPQVGVSAEARRGALALALAMSVLLVSVAWSQVEIRYPQSPIAHVVPGGDSLTSALDRLHDGPVVRPPAVLGQRLLEKYMPDERRSIVLTSADISIEILMRAKRASEVPLGDPWEDTLVPAGHIAPLGKFVDGLKPGQRMLLDEGGRDAFDRYRENPDIEPLRDEGDIAAIPFGVTPLQKWVLKEIGLRFDLKVVRATPQKYEVVELVPLGEVG